MGAKSNHAKQRGKGKNNSTSRRPRHDESAKNIYKYRTIRGKRIRGHGAQSAQCLRGHVAFMLQRRQIHDAECVGRSVVARNCASACNINARLSALQESGEIGAIGHAPIDLHKERTHDWMCDMRRDGIDERQVIRTRLKKLRWSIAATIVNINDRANVVGPSMVLCK